MNIEPVYLVPFGTPLSLCHASLPLRYLYTTRESKSRHRSSFEAPSYVFTPALPRTLHEPTSRDILRANEISFSVTPRRRRCWINARHGAKPITGGVLRRAGREDFGQNTQIQARPHVHVHRFRARHGNDAQQVIVGQLGREPVRRSSTQYNLLAHHA
jgi:hypothetical protein